MQGGSKFTIDHSQEEEKRKSNQQKMATYPNFRLDGKVYAVTGGGRGIGLCIAEGMANAGAEGELMPPFAVYTKNLPF